MDKMEGVNQNLFKASRAENQKLLSDVQEASRAKNQKLLAESRIDSEQRMERTQAAVLSRIGKELEATSWKMSLVSRKGCRT